MIMGHEMAHALREHARERLAKTQATSMDLSIGARLLGLGDLGDLAANLGTQLLALRFSREDETEADLVGLELAARGAYDPQAGVTLWQNGPGIRRQWRARTQLPVHPSLWPRPHRSTASQCAPLMDLYQQARGKTARGG